MKLIYKILQVNIIKRNRERPQKSAPERYQDLLEE